MPAKVMLYRFLFGGTPPMCEKDVKFAAISCTHVPYQNASALDVLCESLAKSRLTDFVMLGDLFESSAVSIHPDGDAHGHTLGDEYEAGAAVLEQIEDALPADCRQHWLLGNHDDNIQTSDSRRTDPRVRDLLHWSGSPFAETFERWIQYPYTKPSIHDQSGMLLLGQVCFVHGYQAGAGSDNTEAKRMRYALGGAPHVLVVRGHTHRPQPVTQCKDSSRPTHCWYANCGTFGPIQPHYMKRKDVSEWGAAVVVGTAKRGRIRRMNRPEWTARTVSVEQLGNGIGLFE